MAAGRNKYRARKVKADGYTFDSRAEARRYGELKLLQMTGQVHGLRVHPTEKLVINGVEICKYTGDFSYHPLSTAGALTVWEDVKGFLTRDSMLRIKIFQALHPGIDCRVLTKETNPRLFR